MTSTLRKIQRNKHKNPIGSPGHAPKIQNQGTKTGGKGVVKSKVGLPLSRLDQKGKKWGQPHIKARRTKHEWSDYRLLLGLFSFSLFVFLTHSDQQVAKEIDLSMKVVIISIFFFALPLLHQHNSSKNLIFYLLPLFLCSKLVLCFLGSLPLSLSLLIS